MIDNIAVLKDINGFDYVVTANAIEIMSKIVYQIIASNIGAK